MVHGFGGSHPRLCSSVAQTVRQEGPEEESCLWCGRQEAERERRSWGQAYILPGHTSVTTSIRTLHLKARSALNLLWQHMH